MRVVDLASQCGSLWAILPATPLPPPTHEWSTAPALREPAPGWRQQTETVVCYVGEAVQAASSSFSLSQEAWLSDQLWVCWHHLPYTAPDFAHDSAESYLST